MNVLLWIAQILLAAAFAMSGSMKLLSLGQPNAQGGLPVGLVAFIGGIEVLGAIGLILPMLLRVKPWLTSISALGFAVIMVLAGGLHAMRGEYSVIGVNVLLLALSVFVAYGRWRLHPATPRPLARPERNSFSATS